METTERISNAEFDRVWNAAPADFKRYCERQDVAEYFYLLGIRDGYISGQVQANETLGEMLRLMRARGLA